jgi:predicted unusual protein kinase regulating ubiquinone biosynthesis (AarF/ABC1/UbiB family)
MGVGSSNLFTSYYLLKDILEINKCIGLYSTQEYNKENYDYLKKIVIRNGCITIKFAQWYISNLRTKKDLNTKNFCKYFEDIFEQCPYHNEYGTKIAFQNNFGIKLYDMVKEDSLIPIASGSIGQVYKAKLKDTDEVVAIKVKHPNVNQDMDKYKYLLSIINWLKQFDYFKEKYYLQFDLNEFMEDLFTQANFNIEAKNAKKFNKLYENNPMIYIPKVINHTKDIIISEYVKGDIFEDLSNYHKAKIAINLYCFLTDSAIMKNFVHTDLHCRNWKARKINDNNYQLVIYDCALTSFVKNKDSLKILWKIFEYDDQEDNLIYLLKNYLIKEGSVDSQLENLIRTMYRKFNETNLDFSYFSNDLLETLKKNQFIMDKSMANIFLIYSLAMEFLTEVNITNSESENIKNRYLVIKNNMFDLLTFCQTTNSYIELQQYLKDKINKISVEETSLDNLFCNLQRNELTFPDI